MADSTEEVKLTAEEYQTLMEANKANIERIGQLETVLNKEIGEKKHLKTLVKDTLGVNEISEDSLKTFADRATDSVTFQKTLQERENEWQQREQELIQTLREEKIRNELHNLGVDERVRGDRAMKTLVRDILSKASESEDGRLVFKEDGKTMYDRSGREMGTAEIVSMMMEADTDHFVFKETVGGGATNGGNTPAETQNQTRMEKVVSDTITSMTTII